MSPLAPLALRLFSSASSLQLRNLWGLREVSVIMELDAEEIPPRCLCFNQKLDGRVFDIDGLLLVGLFLLYIYKGLLELIVLRNKKSLI